jgi:hypothetical protein
MSNTRNHYNNITGNKTLRNERYFSFCNEEITIEITIFYALKMILKQR